MIVKRLFDVILSALGLLILFPLLLIIAIWIKLDSSGPIFFKQVRVGKGFKRFYLFKFRSMVSDAAMRGPLITSGDDQRVTRSGRFLRKTKIDELPQLINVLKGDMSIVGPRPEVPKYVELFRNDYEEVLSVKPGITDYASIEFRNEEEVLSSYLDAEEGYIKEVLPRKIELYRKYLKKKSYLDGYEAYSADSSQDPLASGAECGSSVSGSYQFDRRTAGKYGYSVMLKKKIFPPIRWVNGSCMDNGGSFKTNS